MKLRSNLVRDEDGAAAVEMAFALPGPDRDDLDVRPARRSLSSGGRYPAGAWRGRSLRDLVPQPRLQTGCTAPTAAQIKTQITNSVYGIGPGTFTVTDPASGTSGTAKYYDLTVSYTQPTSLLLFPGPTMSLTRSKRVWISTST